MEQLPDLIRLTDGEKNNLISLLWEQNQLLRQQVARLEEFFIDLFGQSISEGTLANANQKMHNKLEKKEKRIKGLLINSKVLHADETSLRVDKKRFWLHVASTTNLTHYDIHTKRDSEAVEAIGILPKFEGTLIHDHLKSYFKYGKSHSLCNAHHLRELTFIQERYKCKWAKEMETFLLTIKKQVETHYQETSRSLSEKNLNKFITNIKKLFPKEELNVHAQKNPHKQKKDV